MFLAKLCASSSSMPASANMRSAAASDSRLPLAKPWQHVEHRSARQLKQVQHDQPASETGLDQGVYARQLHS